MSGLVLDFIEMARRDPLFTIDRYLIRTDRPKWHENLFLNSLRNFVFFGAVILFPALFIESNFHSNSFEFKYIVLFIMLSSFLMATIEGITFQYGREENASGFPAIIYRDGFEILRKREIYEKERDDFYIWSEIVQTNFLYNTNKIEMLITDKPLRFPPTLTIYREQLPKFLERNEFIDVMQTPFFQTLQAWSHAIQDGKMEGRGKLRNGKVEPW